jgi:hypothetical protein
MAKNKISKNIKNVKIETGLLIHSFKRSNPNAIPVTSESVANKTTKNNLGRYSGKLIGRFQNHLFECNVTDMRTNAEIVEILTDEFPRSGAVLRNGGTFPIDLINGMRTLYNRGKHGNPIPKTLSPLFEIDDNGKRVINNKWNTKNNPTKNETASIK